MTDRELLEQALEALDRVMSHGSAVQEAKDILRERLAQPETVMAEYKHQTYAAYKTDGEMKIGVLPEPVIDKLGYVPPSDTSPERVDQAQKQRHEQEPPVKTYCGGVPNYCTPEAEIYKREWVGLTDAELAEFSEAKLGAYDLCLEVEAKLKEKNNG